MVIDIYYKNHKIDYAMLRLLPLQRCCLSLLLGLGASLFALQAAAQAVVYRFGVVPQFEQRQLFATWKPIIDELSRRSGVQLTLTATLSVPEFERELSRGSFDFVYANPYQVLREYTRQGYLPLVRDEAPLYGILVVRKDSPYKSPAELEGLKLAIPSFNALGASLLLRADLAQVFKVQMVPVNVKTHSSVYLQVASGQLPAGGGVEKTLREQDASVQELLRVLYSTRALPSHPVAAHPRVPPKVRDAITLALLGLANSEAGRQMLGRVPMPKPVATNMQDYLPMRQWGLDRYWVE